MVPSAGEQGEIYSSVEHVPYLLLKRLYLKWEKI